MAVVFLWFNAVMYAAFAVWCTWLPGKTSAAIGFGFTKPAARSEYVTVYGGLELGLAIFFAIAALDPSMLSAGLLLAAVTYGCLAVFRAGTLLTMSDLGKFPLVMFAIELPMALLAGWLYFKTVR